MGIQAPHYRDIEQKIQSQSICLTGFAISKGREMARRRSLSFSQLMRKLLDDEIEKENEQHK